MTSAPIGAVVSLGDTSAPIGAIVSLGHTNAPILQLSCCSSWAGFVAGRPQV